MSAQITGNQENTVFIELNDNIFLPEALWQAERISKSEYSVGDAIVVEIMNFKNLQKR